MRPTLRNVAAIFASHPNAERAMRATGISHEQAAAFVLGKMAEASTPRQRDAIFSNALAAVGVFTSGVHDFDVGTDRMLERMDSKHGAEREAQRMSEESRQTPQYVSPERILALRQVAQQSSIQQGLADRMRAREEHAAKWHHEEPVSPRMRAIAEDERDRRAALNSAFASTPLENGTLPLAERATLRETLSAAYDAHEAVEADRDPLADERLLAMSDAV